MDTTKRARHASEAEVRPEPATTPIELRETDVGSVFVSNYPPYSFWKPDHLDDFERALQAPAPPARPLGLYLHIPFCRRRCKFCYFRVFTDKNAGQIEEYCDALAAELRMYRDLPAVAERSLDFVYFGGGTPSFISVNHLTTLVEQLRQTMSWEQAREIAFECEPGTLSQRKLEAIRDLGVTRLSLGVESFDDEILELNGRAHVSKEIYRVLPWIEELDFPQLNIDLIAGMIGETWETWQETVRRVIATGADTVTVYQMELPYNTRFSEQFRQGSLEVPLADWDTKRAWHDYAFEQLAAAGYHVSSAYTMVRDPAASRFVYREALWHGADMLGVGVSSFGHMSGVHVQNEPDWNAYLDEVHSGRRPLSRAFVTDAGERLTREVILQLKLGRVEARYFADKFGVDILVRYAEQLEYLQSRSMLHVSDGVVELSRAGLLRVDSLLPVFYAPEYQNTRYT